MYSASHAAKADADGVKEENADSRMVGLVGELQRLAAEDPSPDVRSAASKIVLSALVE